MHMFLHLNGARSGANEVQSAHVFAPPGALEMVQVKCKLHMFLHLTCSRKMQMTFLLQICTVLPRMLSANCASKKQMHSSWLIMGS